VESLDVESLGGAMNDEAVNEAADAIRDATTDLSAEETLAAAKMAGIPGPGDVPDAAWQRMSGGQTLALLLVMFLVLVGLLVFLLWLGTDMVTASGASETSKTLGNTIVGAALGMIGAAAAGAGATSAAKK
jgi:hypothetical protein